jgi:hypothetical protein
MRVIAALFIILQALAALALLAISVHGPSGLPLAAGLYLALAAGATAWTAHRLRSRPLVIAMGAGTLALAPGVFFLLNWVEDRTYKNRIAETQVSDVGDEPILSASGRPIGVRISFAVSVPGTGYFGITPSLSSREPATERLRLDAMRWTIDGRPEPRPFEAGRRHAVVVELYPPILFIKPRGERCLSPVLPPSLPEPSAPKPLRLDISETPYGAPWRGGREESTRAAYDLAEMYRGVLAERLEPCKVAQ